MPIKRKKTNKCIPRLQLDPKCQLPADKTRDPGRNDMLIMIIFNKSQIDFINDAISVLGDYAYIQMKNGPLIDLRTKEVNAVYKRQCEEFYKKLERSNEKAQQAMTYVRKIITEGKEKCHKR